MSAVKPLVSVCVPNLNTRPYLQERVDTIFARGKRQKLGGKVRLMLTSPFGSRPVRSLK